ncbi:cbb3-type cytochrome c oxidase subunit 3 [Candidatus Zixiibacteriota bacterium]
MFSDVLQNIDGVEIFPIISLLIFFLFFISVIIWTFKIDKNVIDKLSKLPLDNTPHEDIDGEYENE